MRDISERRGAEEVLEQDTSYSHLLQHVAESANQAHSLDEALQTVLRLIGEHMEWPIGFATYVGDQSPTESTSSAKWYVADEEKYRPFQMRMEQTDAQGSGSLGGRVLASGAPALMPDLSQEEQTPTINLLGQLGIKAGYGFPILIGQDVLGLLEFYASEAGPLSQRVAKIMEVVSVQLGRVLERTRNEKKLRHHQDELKTLVEERTRELLTAKEAAEDAKHAKCEFLSNMWHELRTPMHGILSFSALGLEKVHTATPEKLGTYFELIKESGQRLLKLINSLLDLSTLESDGLSLSFQRQYLRALVETSVQQSEDVLKEKSLKMNVEGSEEPMVLSCDGARIIQVMKNILSNAMKYSPAETTITIRWFPQSVQDGRGQADSEMCPGVCITIRDEGVGIPQDELESVFDKFVQSSRTKTGAGGIGLGLAICRKIVMAHGGRVWADNPPDGGVIICLVLPLDASGHKQQDEEVAHGQLKHTNIGG